MLKGCAILGPPGVAIRPYAFDCLDLGFPKTALSRHGGSGLQGVELGGWRGQDQQTKRLVYKKHWPA